MRNIRYLINGDFMASEVAEDLRVQLEVNRYNHVSITTIENRNEVIVQVHEANGQLEDVVGSFMKNYQSGVILE